MRNIYWCFQIVVLETTLESPLDYKEIKPVNPKGNQPWNIHWKDCCLSWSSNTLATWWEEPTHWKKPWCWERLRAGREGDEMVRWHLWLNGHDSEQTQGDSEGQGRLACCSSWGRKESDATEWLNWLDKNSFSGRMRQSPDAMASQITGKMRW